ncbi:MAG: hypothetical protein ACE5HI_03875 [bacterium]
MLRLLSRSLVEKCAQLSNSSFDFAQDEENSLHGERSRTKNPHYESFSAWLAIN